MQILLTDVEYDVLVDAKKNIEEKMKDTLQRLCIDVAIYKPVKFLESDDPEPWGCILEGSTECCDECPVQDVCPCEFQQWSQ